MSFPISSDEPARLQSLCRLNILDTPADPYFDDLTNLAAQICRAPIALISLIDRDRQWFKSKVGLDQSETPRDQAFCNYPVLQKALFIVSDATLDSRFASNPLVTGEPFIRFYAGAPLIAPDGFALGSLCVIDRCPRELSEEQKAALQMLARQVVAQLMLHRQTNELERANLSLEQSKENYRIVAESASDVIITINEQATILFANPATERVLGYKSEDLINQDLAIIIPERFRAAHTAGLQRYLQSGKRQIPWSGIELPALRRDGQEIQVEISFGENLDGNRRLFTGVIRDITERKRIEAKLRQSEERYRFLAESLPQQVWTALPDGQLDYGNHRTIEYFGKSTQNELFGMRWTKILHPEDRLQTLKRWRHAVNTGELFETEYRLRRSDGEYRWHLAQANPMFDDQNQIIKWFGTNVDIHERKTAEEAARQSAEYRKLFQHANDAILIFEPETEVIVEVNDKACEIYGFERENFVGKSIKEMSQNAKNGEKYLQKLLETGAYQSFETVQFRADATPIDLLVNSSVIEYQGRKVILSINRDVTARKLAEQRLLHNALHDGLTGLPNRTLFLEYLRRVIEQNGKRNKKLFAVLFLDFDHFKVVNDSLGHMEGDNLLKLIANRLGGAVRSGDIVARLGGDEFTILLEDLSESSDVLTIIERIQKDLETHFELSGRQVVISVSIGIALSDNNYKQPEEMLRDADIAMYRAKASGKARHQIFNQKMHEQASRRLQSETELRQALEREEFLVYYQPIINLQTGKINGFESLVRWQHPTRGIVPPLEFISLAEETGLIVALGEWVLRQSCRQLRLWQTDYALNSNLTMSVNLSCRQFIQTDLVNRIAEIVNETKIEPNSLRLEITESHLVENTEASIAIMSRLRALDIKLSIDDFGTGYSSLSYLHRLPINFLKIDRSFVSQMLINSENREIVRTIILLAKNLNLGVIAEGIETSEQADYLKSLNCDFGQGYLYSKPVNPQQAAAFIRGN